MGGPVTGSAFRSRVSTRLDRVADESGRNLPLFLGAATISAPVIVVLLHFVQAWALGAASGILSTLVASLGVVLAATCLTVLLSVFWKIRLDPGRVGLYALAVVLSVITIGICIEVFAGLVALLWQHDMLQAATGDEPSLWRTEGYYLWHLLSSVPLLSAPDTVGWHEPKLFDDQLSGGLLLTFKLVVIAPLFHLGLSAYQFGERRRLETRAKREQREPWRLPAIPPAWTAADAWEFFRILLVWTVVALVSLMYVFDPTWSANRWLLERVEPGLDIEGFHVPVAWLETAPQWLVVVVLLYWSLATPIWFLDVLDEPLKGLRSLHGAVAAAFAYLIMLVLWTATAAGAALALLHVGLAATEPALPEDGHPQAALNAFAWALFDALPGPDIPTTLNWTLDQRFVDHWSGALLLLYKALFIGVLLFPLARLVRTHLLKAPAASPLLAAAKEFTDRLTTVHAAMDEIERFLVARGGDVSFDRADLSPDDRQVIGRCRHAVDELEATLQRVRSLFGDGDVADAANAAETAAVDRFDAIQEHHESYRFFGGQPPGLGSKRANLDRRIADFTQTARAALRQAAEF